MVHLRLDECRLDIIKLHDAKIVIEPFLLAFTHFFLYFSKRRQANEKF